GLLRREVDAIGAVAAAFGRQLEVRTAGRLLRYAVVHIDVAVGRHAIERTEFPVHQVAGNLFIDRGDGCADRRAVARDGIATGTTARRGAVELGAIVIQTYAAVDLPFFIQVDGVKGINRERVGGAMRIRAVVVN